MKIKHSASLGVLEVTNFSSSDANTLAKLTIACNVRSLSRLDDQKTIRVAGYSSLTAHDDLSVFCNAIGVDYPKMGAKAISFTI